jgi:rod shape-determining protein MreD
MILARHQGGWVITTSIVVALMLTILPLPNWAQSYRPEWAALVVLYWCMALPERVGVGIAWIVGILLDVLKGSLLGQHALGLAVIAYLAISLHQRIRVYPLSQQALTILMLLALFQLLVLWFDGITGQPAKDWSYWMPSITSMILWPWVFVILRDLRRRFKVT